MALNDCNLREGNGRRGEGRGREGRKEGGRGVPRGESRITEVEGERTDVEE